MDEGDFPLTLPPLRATIAAFGPSASRPTLVASTLPLLRATIVAARSSGTMPRPFAFTTRLGAGSGVRALSIRAIPIHTGTASSLTAPTFSAWLSVATFATSTV